MKTQTITRKTRTLLAAAVGCIGLLGFTGCMGEAGLGASAGVGTDVVLTGTVSGQAGSASEGEATLVTTHEVTTEGTVGPVIDSARTEADGSFELRTRLRGEKALIVRAVRSGRELRARVQDRLEAGARHELGMIDAFTTFDAETWLELRKTPEGRAILAADIRAAVDAYADSLGAEGLVLDSADRARIVARIVLMAKARADIRATIINNIIVRADSARPPRDSGDTVRPRPELPPCARAAFVLAAMDPDHEAYAGLRAQFAAACLDGDTVPPPPQACRALKARVDGMAEVDSALAATLGLRLAAHCPDAPPPPHLTRCERAAIRLATMDPDRPAYAVLRARFEAHCLDSDPTDDGEVDAGLEVEAGATLRVGS